MDAYTIAIQISDWLIFMTWSKCHKAMFEIRKICILVIILHTSGVLASINQNSCLKRSQPGPDAWSCLGQRDTKQAADFWG